MKISEILKLRGMFSKDIRLRLKNGQLRLNGEPIKEDIEVTSIAFEMIEEDDGDLLKETLIDAGDIFSNIAPDPIWSLRCHVFGFENLFGSSIKNEMTDFLDLFNVLRISKKELIVIRK